MKKLFSTRYSDNGITFAALLLRLTVGILMIPHGFDKLVNYTEKSVDFHDPFHIGSTASLILVIFAEFFCGAFIVVGLFTRLACIAPIIGMAVALFYVHQGDPFGKGEPATLFLGGLLTLLFMGPGKVSLDRLIAK